MVRLPEEQEGLVVVAIGESGEGKSALLNLLLNCPGEQQIHFPESEEPEPCTLEATAKQGLWRGDPGRPLTVLDTPGLGGEGSSDEEIVSSVLRQVEGLGGVHAFIVIIRAGQSRFLSQHQHMFKVFQKVLGEEFWANCIIDVSHSCDARNKKNFDCWLEKLGKKFPSAHEWNPPKVFVDTEEMAHSTLEELHDLCRGKVAYLGQAGQVPKVHIHSSMEDISLSMAEDLSSRQDEAPQSSSRASTSLDVHHDLPRSSSRSSLDAPRTHSRNDYMLPPRSPSMLLDMPPLPPPRSPTIPSRRRTLPPSYPSSYSFSSSTFSSSTPRTPRLSRTHYSSTEDFSSFSSSSTTRSGRRSYLDSSYRRSYSREPSPSYSRAGSREPSPSPPSPSPCSFTTIGLPTYLRTCSAYGKPFTKAMRAGRLLLKHAEEGHVVLESCGPDIAKLPQHHNCSTLISPLDIHLFSIPRCGLELSAETECAAEAGLLQDQPREAAVLLEPFSCHRLAASLTGVLEAELLEELPRFLAPEAETARRQQEPKSELELMKPEAMTMRNAYNLVKKALLPKIKYHWDQGFKQGPSGGWVKCPVIKLKIKYGEEDQDLLPPVLSVEGGGQCETKQVKLDAGKAKCKLRANELKAVQLRVVPLDKAGRQEAWVPEFLFTVEKITGDEVGADKWWKATVSPALPE